MCDRSGPLAEANTGRVAGVEDMVAYIKSSGGIFGAQIDLHIGDTTGTVEGAQRAEARLLRDVEDAHLLILCDSLTEEALAQTIEEDRIPALGPGDFASKEGFIFGLDVTVEDHLTFWLAELSQNWNVRKPQNAGSEIKLAVLGGQVESSEVVALAESFNIQVVMQVDFAENEAHSIFNFIYEARDKGVNAIYSNEPSSVFAALLNALNNLGLRDRFVVLAPAALYDAGLHLNLGDPTFVTGTFFSSAWAWWGDEGNSGIELVGGMVSDDSLRADWGYLQMAAAVDIARQVFEDAILAEGFDTLDRATVLTALENLAPYAALDGVLTVDYSDGNRSLHELAIWQVGDAPGDLTLLAALSPIPAPTPQVNP